MHWLSLSQKGLRARTIVVFDIASATVGCSVIEIRKGEKPHIRFTTRVPLKFQTHFRYDRFVHEMLKAFTTVSEQAKHFLARYSSVKDIENVYCVLSSAWYVSKTHFLSFHREKPFTVSKQFIDKMIERTEDHVEQEKSSARKQKHISDLTIIEKKLLTIALNGYNTDKPFGKRATTIDVALYISFISSTIHKQLTEHVEKQFPDAEVVFYSHALSTYITVRDCYAVQNNFLLLDIGGEVSDIAIIKDDVLQGSVSIPIGVNTLARSLNQKHKGAVEVGRSLMRMAGERKEILDKQSQESSLLDERGKEWREALIQALKKLSSTDLYPRTLFLTAPADTSLWFKKIIEKSPQGEGEEQEISLGVTVLSASLLHDSLIFRKDVPPDPSLSLHSLYVSRIS